MIRFFDFIFSLMGILVLMPVFVVLYVAICMESPGGGIYRQKRVGRYGRDFFLDKFRSMRTGADKQGLITVGGRDPRITRMGYFIRKYKLDELPQLFNVLLGDMSLVGPRPELPHFVEQFKETIPRYMVKHQVRPGITGWAQINGRDELEIPVKAKLDGEYVEKQGFLMDVKCFFGTIVSVLKSDGVVEGGTGELHKQEEKVSK